MMHPRALVPLLAAAAFGRDEKRQNGYSHGHLLKALRDG
jgi:hypothetical protein